MKAQSMFGIVSDSFYELRNLERIDELNERLQKRHLPHPAFQPVLDMNPVSTKYARFPVLDRHSALPAITTSFFAHYNANEHLLFHRNFVPASSSDLFSSKTMIPQDDQPIVQPHELLFANSSFHIQPKYPINPDADPFFNNTRLQLQKKKNVSL